MARKRSVSPDFWTWEAVIDCAAMTRLLFIGLSNFADDFGVQPLRPRTIRLQVFPGDAIDDAAVRAMVDELAAQRLVRIYEVDGQAYLAINEWAQLHPVNKRSKRRYPSPGEEKVPSADEGLSGSTPATETIANHSKPSSALRAPSPLEPSAAADLRGEKEKWLAAIEARLRWRWPDCRPLDAGTHHWLDEWLADGCVLDHDVLAAVDALHTPPAGLNELAAQVRVNRNWCQVAA